MGSKQDYDFSGWATKSNLKCSDGRTILENAFAHNDGAIVPLVWNHGHSSPSNILGHALLENRKGGVYTYGTFNDTDEGIRAKSLVMHGDITNLSICANHLQQNGTDVMHGDIKEVSLVLAGANPGAHIDTVMLHSDGDEETAIIYTDENISLEHSDFSSDEESDDFIEHTDSEDFDITAEIQKQFNSLTDDQQDAVAALVGMIVESYEGDVSHSDDFDVEEVTEEIRHSFEDMNEDQQMAMSAMIGMIVESYGDELEHSEDDEDENSFEGGTEEMKHNLFDTEDVKESNILSHAEQLEIINDAKRFGSLSESVLAHSEATGTTSITYGIGNVDYLYPDAKNLNTPPDFIKRETAWVSTVMQGVHHTAFSRIKSMFADITEDEARAKGYIKGNKKVEEVFGLLKRTTTPTTIYKKQKMDRDDIIDITDFDVVSWIKSEMRIMLDEEIARAILVGDGRSAASADKINELNVRPIWTDDDLFTIKYKVTKGATDDATAKNFIKAAVKSRKNYKGSGTPVLFTTEDMLTDMLLLEDNNGRIIYDSEEKLRTALRVSKIVTVEVMENLTRTDDDSVVRTLGGIIVNLNDYNVGADKGGAVNMFEDFDIDYNQEKYLIETRISGALTKPYSAIALELAAS